MKAAVPLSSEREAGAQEARRELLEQAANEAGARWAEAWREVLRREGRRQAGGWPGTLGEARARVAVHMATELGRGVAALSSDEFERAVRTTYARAKHEWRAHAERELPEPQG